MPFDSSNLVRRSINRVLLYSLLLTALTYLIFFDASIVRENNPFSENSLTEISQLLFLFLVVALFFATGLKDPMRRTFSVFLAAGFLCALIRELDSSFDKLFDGAWQVSVGIVVVTLTVWMFRRKDRFRKELYELLTNPVIGVLFCGFLTVMVFSRFFGREVLWVEIMGDGYMRAVKNAVEEGVELFGYFLCLIAAFEYFLLPKAFLSKVVDTEAAVDEKTVINSNHEVKVYA